jgi:twitching motility protein PilT
LRWVVSQRLMPKLGGGRQAVFEIMGTNLRVKESIVHGESEGKTFYEMMQQSRHAGWGTFDDDIVSHYENGLVSEETALAYASRRPVVKRGIDQIKSARGEKTTDIEGLQMDQDYSRRIG